MNNETKLEKIETEATDENQSWSAWGSWAASAVSAAAVAAAAAADTVTQQANEIADKSINVLCEASEYMQKDLEEFTKVIKEDSVAVYSTVAQKTYESINQYAGEQVAQDAIQIKEAASSILGTGLRSLVDGVEKILLDDESGSDNESGIKPIPFIEDEVEYETNPETYLKNPTDPNYENWREKFNSSIEQRKNKLTEILIARTNVRLMYNKLVPKKVTHHEFWARYLYMLEQADCVPETTHVQAVDLESVSNSSGSPDADQIQSDLTDQIQSDVTNKPSDTDYKLKISSNPSDLEIISSTEQYETTEHETIKPTVAISGSSSNIDDWEKDLDIDGLDITEEEMVKALEEADEEDWDLDLDDV